MSKRPAWFYRQSGAIPVRWVKGRMEILLITNRKGTRWIIPKGIVEQGLSPAESAAKEAWEEAGVRGQIEVEPLGTYRYEKWGGVCTVEVHRLVAQEVAESWPEAESRQRRWLPPGKAAELVREEALKSLIRRLAAAEAPREAASRADLKGETP